ncbi:MAG: hypothetical protein GEV07_28120 [Streptosporangiales bacterium]|nr:hypothetical protein [Streptosporangiales bacterium]
MSITTHLSKRSLLTVLLCLGMVVLVVGIQLAKPSKAQNQFAPGFKTVGRLGAPIEMREGTVMFSDLRSAKMLKMEGFLDKKLASSATWIVVEFEFEPVRENESLDVSLYSSNNTRYRASLRPSLPVTSSINGEPGFTHKGMVAFEVPKSQLVDARLVVGNEGLFGVPLWDSQAVIPLGVDQARADELVDDAPASMTISD